MMRFRNRARVSDSVRIGPFRFRISEPLGRRGRGWGSVGMRAGRRGWLSFSTPLGGARRRGGRRLRRSSGRGSRRG
jgi:hypothetical protein